MLSGAGEQERSEEHNLAEKIGDAVGDSLCEAVLEGAVSEKGGFITIRQIAQLDQNGGSARFHQDVVICLSRPVAAQARAAHRILQSAGGPV